MNSLYNSIYIMGCIKALLHIIYVITKKELKRRSRFSLCWDADALQGFLRL